MSTKLKGLKVKKIDFVDQGANQDANIMLFKRKDGVPEVDPKENDGGEKGNVWKRMFTAIAKFAGVKPEEISSAMEEIEKGSSETFAEKIAQRKNQKIADEMWDICFALQSSLCSIMWDDELDTSSASSTMQESLDEFYQMVKDSIDQWANGKAIGISKSNKEISACELNIMKSANERLSEEISKVEKAPEVPVSKSEDEPKGETEMSKIDKSKMTDAERAFFEDIVKRCSTEDGMTEEEKKKDCEKEKGSCKKSDAVTKALEELGIIQPEEKENDIYKGISPELKAEFESLRKFKEDAEEKELRSVAKRYEIIGKKEDELYPVLKSIKAAGTEAYDQLIAALDGAKAAVEKSGAFSEIGKSGHPAGGSYGTNENSAEAKISGIAKSYVEKNPTMSYTDALAKAWEENPELIDAYEEEAGF